MRVYKPAVLGVVFVLLVPTASLAEDAVADPQRQPAAQRLDSSADESLVCQQVRCRTEARGVDTPSSGNVVCECHFDPIEASPLPPEPSMTDEALDEELRILGSSELPELLDTPVAVAAFGLGRSRVGVRLDVGFPFIDFEVMVRLHEVFQLGIGYRTAYGVANAGYGSFKLRFYQNATDTVAFALVGRGGYTHAPDLNGEWLAGNNGAFGEALLALSFRWGRHAIDVHAGFRFGWIRWRDCESDLGEICWGAVFSDSDGRSGLLLTTLVEIGWAFRISPHASYFFSGGVQIVPGSDQNPLFPLGRTGLLFDF